jgi:hypothetical protein
MFPRVRVEGRRDHAAFDLFDRRGEVAGLQERAGGADVQFPRRMALGR